MLRVGLTGGLGSGKTFVGKTLESLGAHLIQADELGHQVLMPQGEAYGPVLNEFGSEILDDDGFIDRRKLAGAVFSDPQKLAKLNSIVHPAVGRLQARLISEIERTEPDAIVVVEAAILVETGSYRNFDRLIVAECTPEQQVQRAMHRNGFTEAEALARIERQLPPEEKRRVAHYTIDTSGPKERTVELTGEVYRLLRSLQT